MKRIVKEQSTFDMIDAFTKRIEELESSSSVESSTFIDVDGMFGNPGDLYTDIDIEEYWESEHDNDPSLAQYDSFIDWYNDTKKWLKPVKASSLVSREGHPVNGLFGATEYSDMTQDSWKEIDTKQVRDVDGFWTDYTLYQNELDGRFVCVFGDKDIYRPEDGSFDWEGDSAEEAYEWFNSYEGFSDDDVFSASSIELDEDLLMNMFEDSKYSVQYAGYCDDGTIIITLPHNADDIEEAAEELGRCLNEGGVQFKDWNVNGRNVFLFESPSVSVNSASVGDRVIDEETGQEAAISEVDDDLVAIFSN